MASEHRRGRSRSFMAVPRSARGKDEEHQISAELLTRRADGYTSFSVVASLISGIAIRSLSEISKDPDTGLAASCARFLCALVVCTNLFGIVVFALQHYYVRRLLGADMPQEAQAFLDHDRTRWFRNLALRGVLFSVPAYLVSLGIQNEDSLVAGMMVLCAAAVAITIVSMLSLLHPGLSTGELILMLAPSSSRPFLVANNTTTTSSSGSSHHADQTATDLSAAAAAEAPDLHDKDD